MERLVEWLGRFVNMKVVKIVCRGSELIFRLGSFLGRVW